MMLLATLACAAVQLAAANGDFVDSPQPDPEHLAARKLHNHNRLRSHSTLFDKPTPHPTTLGYLNSPYHYGNYANNLDHQRQYFYEWPHQMHQMHQSHSTYSPTASPIDDTIIPTYSPTPSSRPTSDSPTLSPTRTSSPSTSWSVLAHEHFIEGMGVFQDVDSQDTHHYSSTLGRQGVIQLQKSATLSSYDIAVDSSQASSQLKVAFSFYANSMGVGEGFCLEYILNDDIDWNPVRCWQSSIDFENSKWNDDLNAELHLDDRIQVDSLRIRFLSIASSDDVDIMFDHISLLQLR